MAFKLGNDFINDVKLGETQVQKIMLGTDLIWQKALPVGTFVSTWKTDNTGNIVTGSNQIKIPFTNNPISVVVNWGDGSSDVITVSNAAACTHTYLTAGTYIVSITGVFSLYFTGATDRSKLLSIQDWGSYTVTPANQGFQACNCLTMIDVVGTPSFTANANCEFMFGDCVSLVTINLINTWDVSNVVNMRNMFEASAFNQNIGNWNVGNVVNMSRMFRVMNFNNGGSNDIGNWNTSNVINMYGMFDVNRAFTRLIGRWNVSNITVISDFFRDNYKTTTAHKAMIDDIFIGWSSRPVKPSLSIAFEGMNQTTASVSARSVLTSAPNNWVISGGTL